MLRSPSRRSVSFSRCRFAGQSVVKRIQRPMIERDGDAAVADLGQHLDRLERIVVGEAVGVVAQKHVVHVS